MGSCSSSRSQRYVADIPECATVGSFQRTDIVLFLIDEEFDMINIENLLHLERDLRAQNSFIIGRLAAINVQVAELHVLRKNLEESWFFCLQTRRCRMRRIGRRGKSNFE